MDNKELEAWKKGFSEALGWRDNYKFEILGHNIDYIVAAISEYEQKQLKIINVIDESKVEIRRNGKVVYSERAKHETTRKNEGLSSFSRNA